MIQKQARISGLGAYLPEKVVTNFDLAKIVETSDEWIQSRTGIRERRIVEPGTPTSDLAAKAALEALKNAKLKPADMDLLIVATISPDMLFPSTACIVQKKIGATCPGFDISAACSGFPYALAVADGLIHSGMYRHILVIGAEAISAFINWKDRATCVLFGDGAGAAVVSKNEGGGQEILATYLGSDGTQADLLKIPAGGSAIPTSENSVKSGLHYVQMEGTEVFKAAVRTMCDAAEKVIRRAGLKMSDIDCLIPHQANLRIINAIANRLDFPQEKIFVNLDRYGNMSAASTIVAFYEAVRDGRVKKDSVAVLVAFGSGFTWAAATIRW